MNALVYVLPFCLAISVLLFLKALLISRRFKQWPGLLMAILAMPLFVFYYKGFAPFQDYDLRGLAEPLASMAPKANPGFRPSILPVSLIGAIYAVRVVVFLRLAVRSRRQEVDERLRKVNDRVGNFFAFTTVAILLDAITVSTFSLGWAGALSIAGLFALLYLGVVGIFADTFTLVSVVGKFGSVVMQRRLLWVATTITRPVVWLADLYKAIRLNLRDLIEKVRQATKTQQEALIKDEDVGDDALTKAERERELSSAKEQEHT